MPKKTLSNFTIFVGGLPGSTTKEALLKHFRVFGAISKVCTVKNSKQNNLNKGYALITYESEQGYKAALRMPEQFLYNRNISCQPYLKGPELSKYLDDFNSRRLFIKYIPKDINNKKFEDIFKKYGEVDFGYVVKDPKTQVSRGFGYIAFKSLEDAQEVGKFKFIKIRNGRKLKIFPYKRRGSETDESSSAPNQPGDHSNSNSKQGRKGAKPSAKAHRQLKHQLSKQKNKGKIRNSIAYEKHSQLKNRRQNSLWLELANVKPTHSKWFAQKKAERYNHHPNNLKFQNCHKHNYREHQGLRFSYF